MYYIQNPTSNLKNAIDELARKYGKEFNGDVEAFVRASKYASANSGVDNYLEQVFDIANGGGEPPVPIPVINVNDITGVPENGVTNATTSIVITNGDGWDIVVTTDGVVVTSASVVDSSLVYSVAMNSSTERSGSITITMSMSGQQDVVKTISVTQLGAYTQIEWIKFTKGGYIDTGQVFEVGDRIQFKFALSDSVDSFIFGACTYRNNASYKRITLQGNSNNCLISDNTIDSSDTAHPFVYTQNNYLSLNTIYDIDFNYNSTSKSNYNINNVNISNIEVDKKPNTDTEYTLYINSLNWGGQTIYERKGSIKNNSITIYEYKMIDVNGNIKCDIVPVLINNVPKFKDVINNRYIEILSMPGFTPTITYA